MAAARCRTLARSSSVGDGEEEEDCIAAKLHGDGPRQEAGEASEEDGDDGGDQGREEGGRGVGLHRGVVLISPKQISRPPPEGDQLPLRQKRRFERHLAAPPGKRPRRRRPPTCGWGGP